MMKSFRVVSVDVKLDKSSVESFALGNDARVVIGFDRPLSKLEALRVSKEAAKFVGDEDRVSCSSSSLTVRTRDFDSVRGFVEAANVSAAEWCEDVVAEAERAKAVLSSAAESLESVVVWRKNGTVL